MLGHTKKHRTEESSRTPARQEVDKSISLDDFIKRQFGDLPNWAIALKGFRIREGLTQASLGSQLGIAQTNISQMELGKRPIGKALAKKFAEYFKTDYRLFL